MSELPAFHTEYPSEASPKLGVIQTGINQLRLNPNLERARRALEYLDNRGGFEPLFDDGTCEIYKITPEAVRYPEIESPIFKVNMADKKIINAPEAEIDAVRTWSTTALETYYKSDRSLVDLKRHRNRAKTADRLVVDNPAAHYVFGDIPANGTKPPTTLGVWRKELVPSAMALDVLQNPNQAYLRDADRTLIDEEQRLFFKYCLDAVGIRSRASVMTMIIEQSLDANDQDDSTKVQWLSLASGAADPVMKAASRHSKEGLSVDLVDLDPRALEYAKLRAHANGFNGNLNTIHGNLLAAAEVQHKLGEVKGGEVLDQYDIVDILGFFEYLPDERIGSRIPSASDFLQTAYTYLKPGGKLVLGNMLDTHPGLDFTLGVVEWPLINPRSLADIETMITAAGISPDQIEFYIPEDGVYAVASISKPVKA